MEERWDPTGSGFQAVAEIGAWVALGLLAGVAPKGRLRRTQCCLLVASVHWSGCGEC